MSANGHDFYDNDTVFATYMTSRKRVDNPNDVLEQPVILDLAGDLSGQRILDLGCGDAAFGRLALERGCRSYVGVEGSQNMVAAARQMLTGTAGTIVHAPIEQWDYPAEAFDLVVARLVLHYLGDLDTTFARVHHTLSPSGRFVFSVEHPVITSCDRGWPEGSPRQDWIVDNYFETGLRVTKWMGGEVRKYHRTVEDYFVALQRAGFTVDHVRESRPQQAHFSDEAAYARRMRIPLFLFMAGRKAA